MDWTELSEEFAEGLTGLPEELADSKLQFQLGFESFVLTIIVHVEWWRRRQQQPRVERGFFG